MIIIYRTLAIRKKKKEKIRKKIKVKIPSCVNGDKYV